MQFNNRNLRQFLQDYRIKRDMSQKEMAEKLKVSRSYLCVIEGGSRRLTAKFLCKLLVGFDFKRDELKKFLSSIEKDLGYRAVSDKLDIRIATIIGFLEADGEALRYIRKVSRAM